jgi:hypothetical protein
MVRSFFQSMVGVWGRYLELLGIGGFCLATGRLSRVVVPSAAGRVLRKTPIYHDSPTLGLPRDSFASARHFPLGRPLANLTLNPDRKQCWQLAVRHPSLSRM